jgi:hemoglobin
MKHDIETREDINLLITQFYSKLLVDEIVKHFFEDIIAEDKLNHHIGIIVDFWEDIILNTVKYGRNAMKPHLAMNTKKPFFDTHFDTWLQHFNTTIDANFKGNKVELAKTRALSIATVMKIKMQNS